MRRHFIDINADVAVNPVQSISMTVPLKVVGTKSFVYNVDQNGYSLHFVPTHCRIKSISFLANNANSSASNAGGLMYLLWSSLNNNYIGFLVNQTNHADTGAGSSLTVTDMAFSNPNTFIDLKKKPLHQIDFAFFQNSALGTSRFANKVVTMASFITSMTIDFYQI